MLFRSVLDALATPVEWARSVRPIHVAIYASVRFHADAADDPTALTGDPAAVAAGMANLVRQHQPDTIGLALVDGDRLGAMMEQALETIRLFSDIEGVNIGD